jgi:hypothetical protein
MEDYQYTLPEHQPAKRRTLRKRDWREIERIMQLTQSQSWQDLQTWIEAWKHTPDTTSKEN